MTIIAMIIAFNGFRDEEFFIPYEQFQKANYKVIVYSSQKGIAVGKLGGKFEVKHTLNEFNSDEISALVLVGGPGGYAYLGNKQLHKIILDTAKNGKLVAAICMAPQIVAQTGLLKGKKATIFVGDKDTLSHYGVKYTGKQVEEDGQFISADGPASAELFAKAIIKRLSLTL